jgi:hypothetical protein
MNIGMRLSKAEVAVTEFLMFLSHSAFMAVLGGWFALRHFEKR